jgi:hypothetical protein
MIERNCTPDFPHVRVSPVLRMPGGLRIEDYRPGALRKSSATGGGLRLKFNTCFPNRLMCSVANGLNAARISSLTGCPSPSARWIAFVIVTTL